MRVPVRLLLWLEVFFASPVWGLLKKGKAHAVNQAVLRGSEVPWSPRYLKNYHLALRQICLMLATSGRQITFQDPISGRFVSLDLCSAASSLFPSAGTPATI